MMYYNTIHAVKERDDQTSSTYFQPCGVLGLRINMDLVLNSKLENFQTTINMCFCQIESRKTSTCHLCIPFSPPRALEPLVSIIVLC